MTYIFVHKGRPHPQGRPKITTKPFPKVYYSGPSTVYRKELVKSFAAQAAGKDGLPLTCAEVCIYVWGLRKNADPDNMAKQVLDALVTAGVLAEDDWTHIPVLIVRCYEAEGKNGKVMVTLTPTIIVEDIA